MLLAKLRMPDDDVASADWHAQVAERRLAGALSIDPHLRPVRSDDADDSLGCLDIDGRRFTGRHLDAARFPISELTVRDFELMAPGREHDLSIGRAEQPRSLGDLQLEGRIYRDPAGVNRFVERRVSTCHDLH